MTLTGNKGHDDIDFEGSGGKLESFNDGHVPETFSQSKQNSQLVRYPLYNQEDAEVHVYDNVLPPTLIQALYETTVHQDSPWGTYVTLEQAKEYWEQQRGSTEHSKACCSERDLDQCRHDLAIQATAHFLAQIMSSDGTTWKYNSSGSPLFSSWHELEKNDAHGIAVWALASDVSSQVQYHLDYAELIRYEHNVIVPPLYAGTIQCTPAVLEGGDFCVQLNGLSHYQQHGYKGNKSKDEWAGWTQPACLDSVHCNDDTSWITIPYRCNRGICHLGHLPHLSTPVRAIENGQLRVIVGFNVFCKDVGPLVQQAPEHSNSFRRRIQLLRSLLKKSTSISIDCIRQSKGLTKLLVLAKREKVKQEFRQAQRQLDKDIEEMLLAADSQGLRLSTLMEKLGKTDGTWPNPVDVQVHVSHRVNKSDSTKDKEKGVMIRCSHDPTSNNVDCQGILSADATLYVETV